jgi:glutaredoxin/glutathione-dependent peroxiredoxin
MTISVGDRLPEATLIKLGDNGPEAVSLSATTKGRKVVIFAVPGAYTGVCTTAHVPSFIRTRDKFAAKGVDEIICVSVNDPFVMKAWGESTGANKAGIAMLADADCTLTEAMGMRFDAPPAGLLARSKRYALYAEDGVVKVFQAEESPGLCNVSGGEAMLEAI